MPPNSNGQTVPLKDHPDRLDRPKSGTIKKALVWNKVFDYDHATFIFADFFDFSCCIYFPFEFCKKWIWYLLELKQKGTS